MARKKIGEDIGNLILCFWSHKARVVDEKQELDRRSEV